MRRQATMAKNRQILKTFPHGTDISHLKLRRNNNTEITLKLVLMNFNTYSVNPNISYKFIY